MHVDVFPREAAIVPGQQQVVSITVTNTTTIIGGFSVRVLGADPGWVNLDVDEISLFPDEVRTLVATITPPRALPAGTRRIAVQVRELTAPFESSITELDLTVPALKSMKLKVDPISVTGGRSASFSVIAENTGNTVINGRLDGSDPEARLRFDFQPDWLTLAPGEHVVVDARAAGRRQFMGNPAVRMIGLYLDEVDEPFFEGGRAERPVARDEKDALANATFIQRSLVSRGSVSLVGLLVAVSVFAIVITVALSRLVGQSTADRDLALQVAAARDAGGTTGTSGIAGVVRQLTSGQPESGVSVSVYTTSDTTKPIGTTATDSTGTYRFNQLAAGGYKLSFRGAGFVQIWYPAAADASTATTVNVVADQQRNGVNVTLGGVPATISGTVAGDDVSASTLYLEQVASSSGAAPASRSAVALGAPRADPGGTGTTPGSGSATGNPVPDDGNAIVQTVPIGSDGTFDLTNVPSPATYQLVVTKTGYAPSTQLLDVSAGEARTGVTITLRKGDGLISGTVSSATSALGGVTLTASSGQSMVETVSLTTGTPGSFTLRNLPTPGAFTLVARKSGYVTQTQTLTLTAGQKLTGVAITLGKSSGSLSGSVTTVGNVPAPGVDVEVTDGQRTVQTQTQSTGDVGSWTAAGLPVPGTYTVTFSRSDLASQTVSVTLDSAGNVSQGSQGARVDAKGRITVTMQSATAVVYGTVTQPSNPDACKANGGLGEATVTLNSGTTTYTVTTASVPAAKCGQYRIEQLPPGTYALTVSAGAGTTVSSQVFTLSAGQSQPENVQLKPVASITGIVTTRGANPVPLQGWTVFLYSEAGYATTVLQTATTDADGHFSFAGVDAGDYVLAAGPSRDPSNADATKLANVQPSKTTKVVITVSQ